MTSELTLMDETWRDALYQQFGAAIDTLEKTLLACPDEQWHGQLWRNYTDPTLPPEIAPFWYITYHTLFWLDLYLTGTLEGFAPPAPFTLSEIDPAGVLPERPYTKDELHAYLIYLHNKCQATINGLTDAKARQRVPFRWPGGAVSFLELLLYTMRHVQEHGAQLNLYLGQHEVKGITDWVPRAENGRGTAASEEI